LDKNTNLISNISSFPSDNDSELLQALEKFIQEYKRNKQIHKIPIRLFGIRLGVLETIVKYLRETGLSYAEIAKILERDQRTIWTSYNKATKKQNTPFTINSDDQFIDIGIFADKKYSPMQRLVTELISKGYSLKDISSLLNRSYKNIWMIKKGLNGKRRK
jgi:DNA-binding CsgD family transcriptional regulator